MISPSPKSMQMERLLEQIVNRQEAITNEMCIRKPIGCGEPVTSFTDEISAHEFCISGLCQKCQDKIFTGEE